MAPIAVATAHVQAAAGRDVTLADAVRAHRGAVTLSASLVAIYDHFDDDAAMLGSGYAGLDTDWTRLRRALGWLEAARPLLGGAAHAHQIEQIRRPIVQSAEVGRRVDAFTAGRDSWSAAFDPARRHELEVDLDADLVDGIGLLTSMHDSCATDVVEWDAHVTAIGELRDAGLRNTLDHLVERRLRPQGVPATVEWAALQAWVEDIVTNDPRLRHHRAVDRDSSVDRFRDLDQAQVAKANVAVAHACSARRPAP